MDIHAYIANTKEKKIKGIYTGENLEEEEVLVISLFEVYQNSGFHKNYFIRWIHDNFSPYMTEGEDYFIDTNFHLKKFKKHWRYWITLPSAIFVCGLIKTKDSGKIYEKVKRVAKANPERIVSSL